MNPITAALQLPALQTAQLPRQASTDTVTPVSTALPPQATQVSLGQDNRVSDAQTYSSLGLMSGAQTQYAWETDARDALSTLMLTQLKSNFGGARFQGLGAALLEQLAGNGGKAISQSILAYAGDTGIEPGALKLKQDGLRAQPLDSVTFSLKTASGATVELSLASGEQGLAVSAQVLGGELSSAELKGLGALADSFQSAIDGLTRMPPKLQLGELTRLDPALFSSVQLNARLQATGGEQTFALQLDDSTRSVRLDGPSGNVALNLDAGNTELLGNTAQRQAAISHYLEQFDAAQKRGKGDENLMALFKDAFEQLNRADERRSYSGPTSLSDKERSLLSGLADFSASISEASDFNNPMRPDEAERFTFSASQNSIVRGAGTLNLAVEQNQQSALKASYHQGLNPLVALALSTDRESQNYRYTEIDDQASSNTRLAYKDGKLIEASATQHASQTERVRTYVNGELTDDVRTPASVTQSRNLLGLLNEVFEQERIAQRQRGASILETQLQPQREQWLLQGKASKIRD